MIYAYGETDRWSSYEIFTCNVLSIRSQYWSCSRAGGRCWNISSRCFSVYQTLIVNICRPSSTPTLVRSADDMPSSSLHLYIQQDALPCLECSSKWNSTRGMHHRGKSERALYVRRTGGAFHKHCSSGEAQGRRDEHHHEVWGTVNVTRSERAAVGSFG